MELDEKLLRELITCKKRVIQAPNKPKLIQGSYRIDFELQSLDKEYSFKGFGRYNARFQENFSIGLRYVPKQEKESLVVLRCNGKSGECKSKPHHIYCHIHKIATIEKSATIEQTDKYETFTEAMFYFIEHIHVQQEDIYRYFGESLQIDLFGE